MPLLSIERSVTSLSTISVSFCVVTTLLLATWKTTTKQTSLATYKSTTDREEKNALIIPFNCKRVFLFVRLFVCFLRMLILAEEMRVWYRRIFVYNICLITISDTVSDGATKRFILNIERAQHD